MTATYSIPETLSPRFRFRSKQVRARAIKAIIPTYEDWQGLRITLDSLLNLKTPPVEIRVANDNPKADMPAWLQDYRITLVNYPGNLGPAQARNRAFGFQQELPGEKVIGMIAAQSRGNQYPVNLKNGYCPHLKQRQLASAPDM